MSPKPEDVKVVGLLGLGTMGRGIAKACLASGMRVVFHEIDRQTAEKNLGRLGDDLLKKVEKGKLSKDAMGEILTKISIVDDLAEMADLNFIIEAIFEDLRLKESLYKQIDKNLSHDAVLCSNTSSLGISDLSAHLKDPSRFAGMHFFNPADVMRLVEVSKGTRTSESTIKRVCDFAVQLGKTPIVVPDIPGFYVNRILFPMIIEGIRVKEETGRPSKDIDDSMKLGAGMPMGPLELSDMIGLDVTLHICETLHRRTGERRFEPPAILSKMVKDGKLGKKTKTGFYNYD
jgi:3-hydroxybutyryl-CoA dehydrogenase